MAITSGVLEFTVYGQILETGVVEKRTFNRWHYAQSVPGGPIPDFPSLLTTFTTTIVQPLCALLSSDFETIQIGVRLMDQHSNQETLSILKISGTKSGERLPAYAAVCVQLLSNLRGRSYRGSKHVSPIAEIDTTGDQLAAAVQPAWRTWATTLNQPMTVGGQTLIPVVLSRKNSQLNRDPITLSAAGVTGSLLNLTLGTLRRRKEKTVIA